MEKRTICIDFDGTIVEHMFPRIGPLKAGVKEAIDKLSKNYEIVISSCRASTMFNQEGPGTSVQFIEMVDFLKQNKIYFDRIDNGTEGKVVAHAYIDDRGISFKNNWAEIAEML